jgi:hypothetical protein
MPVTCLTKEKANQLREGVAKGEFDVAKMFEMTTAQRRALFEKYLDKENSTFVNTAFERAMTSSRDDALSKWAENTFIGKDPKVKATVMDRVKGVKEILNGEQQIDLIEDILAEKLGITVTPEELQNIIKYTDKMESAYTESEGLTVDQVENYDLYKNYFKAENNLRKYLQSIEPSSNWNVFVDSTGKMVMLGSIKSPALNVFSNTLMKGSGGIINQIESVLAGKPLLAGLNTKYATDYVKSNTKLFWETGYDTSRMDAVGDTKMLLGEKRVSAEGPGVFKAVARPINRIIGDASLGTPDAFFASWSFANKADYASSIIALKEGWKGIEIFKDAALIEPRTPEGKLIREEAKSDARYFTFTNKSWAQEIGKNSRNWLNTASGKVRLGDATIPFVNTPANVVAVGVDSTGVTSLFKAKALVDAVKQGDKAGVRSNLRALYMAGLGWLGAWLVFKMLKPEEYIGSYASYSPAEKRLIEEKNGVYNSIKIGGKYVSLDYFAGLGGLIAGLMESRDSKTRTDKGIDFVTGITRQVLALPGVQELADTLRSTYDYYESKDKEQLKRDLSNGVVDFFTARVIPALLSDVASMQDTVERKATSIEDKVKRKIPFLREQLEPKITLFGEDIKTNDWTIFTGARYKIAKDNPVINELNRLSSQGSLPSLADISYTSSRVVELKSQIGEEKFKEAIIWFGTNLYKEFDKTISSSKYNKMSDEDRKKELNKVRQDILDDMLKKYKYKEPKKK